MNIHCERNAILQKLIEKQAPSKYSKENNILAQTRKLRKLEYSEVITWEITIKKNCFEYICSFSVGSRHDLNEYNTWKKCEWCVCKWKWRSTLNHVRRYLYDMQLMEMNANTYGALMKIGRNRQQAISTESSIWPIQVKQRFIVWAIACL